MGIRFRKSIKIMPGVRINLSKSGISTTIGPRGASINIGKNGTYLNTGIPGTGLYMREKIGEGRNQARPRQSSSTNKGNDPEFIRKYELYKPISLKINNTGKIEIIDKNDELITDELFLKKIQATDFYKIQKEQLISQWREKSEQLYQKSQGDIAELVNIHQYSFPVKTLKEYEDMLSVLETKQYRMRSFDQKEPLRSEIEKSLVDYAAANITSKAFWRIKKLREEYVSNNLEPEYQKQHAEWERKKLEFEQNELIEAERQNTAYAEQKEKQRNEIREMIAGSEEFVKAQIENWLSNSTLPVEVDVSYEYQAENGNMYIDIMLPPEDVIPQQEIIKLANGGVKEKAKSRTTIQTEYASMIFGLGICVTSAVFDISPAIKFVITSGFAMRRDKDGNRIHECLYSMKYDRTGFEIEGDRIREQSPFVFINKFENRYKATSTWVFKAITPFEDY